MRRCVSIWLTAVVVAGVMVGCDKSRSTTSKSADETDEPTKATPVSDARPEPAKPATRLPPRAGPKQPSGRPTSWGDYCAAASDCAWDEPCAPTACRANKSKRDPRVKPECEESAPPPGTCECVEHRCTLRPNPKVDTASKAACAGDHECAVDPATARCYMTKNPSKQRLQRPLRVEGPLCRCDAASKRCKLDWVPKVSCKTFRDCGWSTGPVRHPVRATKPRKRKRRPCVDGPFDSVCVPDKTGGGKHCAIVSWRC